MHNQTPGIHVHEETRDTLGSSKHDVLKELVDALKFRSKPQENIFRRYFCEHFGVEPLHLPVVTREIHMSDLPNFTLALAEYLKSDGREHKQYGFTRNYNEVNLSNFVTPNTDSDNSNCLIEGPMRHFHFRLPDHNTMPCVTQGLYLIQEGDKRLAVLVNAGEQMFRESVIEVMAGQREDAERFLEDIHQRSIEKNIYRGHVLAPTGAEGGGFGIVVNELPEIKREALILPPGLLERIERHTIVFSERRETMLKAQRHLKRGLLLHGAPGTGKTMTAMYLATAMKGRTTVSLTGRQFEQLARSCRLAKDLQPSTIILEDIDLIAEERSRSRNGYSTALLFELLNEMDGLSDDLDVLFILTTNRPEILEPALAERPGRIDLAINIPVPDDDCRRRLFELYGQGLDLRVENMQTFIDRTKGASAAFIREVLRKAALFADEVDGKLCVKDEQLDAALKELSAHGNALTKSLLGFKQAK